jgi:hypothetical protein
MTSIAFHQSHRTADTDSISKLRCDPVAKPQAVCGMCWMVDALKGKIEKLMMMVANWQSA